MRFRAARVFSRVTPGLSRAALVFSKVTLGFSRVTIVFPRSFTMRNAAMALNVQKAPHLPDKEDAGQSFML